MVLFKKRVSVYYTASSTSGQHYANPGVLIDYPSGQYKPILFARDCFVLQERFCFDHYACSNKMAELKSASCFIFCVSIHLDFVSVQKRQKRNWQRKIFSHFDLTLGVRSCLKKQSRLSSNLRYPLWRKGALWSFQARDCFCSRFGDQEMPLAINFDGNS